VESSEHVPYFIILYRITDSYIDAGDKVGSGNKTKKKHTLL